MAICTKVVEVAAFIDHTDRCRLQAQRGLNAREFGRLATWCRSGPVSQLQRAGDTLPATLAKSK